MIESEAYRKVQEIEGEADAKATEIYAKAYDSSPESRELFEFIKTMEAYKKILTADTSLILSTDSELLHYLKSPDKKLPSPPAAAAGGDADPLNRLPTLMDLNRQ
jgi:membrane protease subunit HflC